jgi:peptidoglycan/LPS O-acetylase OafA/YrhL
VLVPAALALLTFTFVYRADWFRETVRYTLQGIALTPIFVAAIRFPRWAPFRALNAKPVAFVGVLSYSLYLIHQVTLFAFGYSFPSLHAVPRGIVALATSFVLAVAIYYFVEQPCARVRKRLARRFAIVG